MKSDAYRDGSLVVICQKCGKSYREMFDTIVSLDYVEPGKGKPKQYHLCIDCRKNLLAWFEKHHEVVMDASC